MNGFEKHGIKHSSASAINMWCDAPDMWVAQYLYGKRGVFAPAAKAGVLVEEAIVKVLAQGISCTNAVAAAIAEYNKFIALGCSDADRSRGEGIEGMIANALNELSQYGTPEFDKEPVTGKLKQKKVELTCNGDGWTLPIIGYVDFYFPSHGVVFDLKTTMRMPAEMSDSHHRQACIYQKSFGNQAVRFLYVTPKKAQVFDCGDVSNRLGQIKSILNRQERFLALGDKELLRSVVPVMKSSFYTDDTITSELYGI